MKIKCVFPEHFHPSLKKKKGYIIASLLLPRNILFIRLYRLGKDGIQENVKKEWSVLEVSPESACHVKIQ